MSTLYTLKDSLVLVSIIDQGSIVNFQFPQALTYTVILSVPDISTGDQSGNLQLRGPQKVILILPLAILPIDLQTQMQSRHYCGTFRETLLSEVLGTTTITLADLPALATIAITKGDEYETRATNTISPLPSKG